MELPPAQVIIQLVAAVTGFFLAGCSNPDEPFFRVNNPFTFQEEAKAVKQLFSRAPSEPKLKQPEPENSASAYFRGDVAVGAPSRATTIGKQSSAKSLAQPSGNSTICYRCNGKGYRMAVQGQEAGEFTQCPDCRGTGRIQ